MKNFISIGSAFLLFFFISKFSNAQYCASTFGTSIYENITNVTYSNINNSSGAGPGYNDYTSQIADVVAGTSSQMSVTITVDGTEYIYAFIDWNQNDILNDPGEVYVIGSAVTVAGTYSANITVPFGAIPGPTRMRVMVDYNNSSPNPCRVANYGEVEDYTVNVLPPPADEAGLVAFVSPGTGCTPSDSVVLTVSNFGTSSLTSVNFNVSVNGGSPTVFPWTGSIPSGGVDTVFAGVVTINSGDAVKVWVSDPNGSPDVINFNDTLTGTFYDALSGTYTIGGTLPDYATINDAITDLLTFGVCSSVIFDIRNGVYNEQMTLTPVLGASAVNTVTFRSESLDANDVKIEYTPIGVADNWVVRFNGARHIIFDELTLANVSPTYARVIEYRGGTQYTTVENSIIIGDTNVTGTTSGRTRVVIWSGQDTDSYNTIRNNDVRGGEWGISLWGVDPSTMETGNVIEGNTVSGYFQVGIIGVYQESMIINHNTVLADSTTGNSQTYCIDLEYGLNGVSIVGNTILNRNGGFGISTFYVQAQPNQPSLIANNFINMGNINFAPSFDEAIYTEGVNNMDIIYNSINQRSQSTSSACLTILTGFAGETSTGINITNNNLVNTGAGYLVLAEVPAYINASMFNYNNLYAPNSAVAYIGTTPYVALSDLQSGTSTNANSVSVDPLFNGDDLHTCRVELNAAALPFASVTTDHDGDPRSSTPDIGADEFFGAVPFSLGPDTTICAGTNVTLSTEDNHDAIYNWTPASSTTNSLTLNQPGTYILEVVTSCGTQSDTVVVNAVPLPVAGFNTNINFFTLITTNTSTGGTTYHWNFGDGNTSNAFEPFHVYGQNGVYTVTLTVYNECGDSSSVARQITIDVEFAGIEEEIMASLNVYPNPTADIANVSLNYPFHSELTLAVLDISGRMVYQTNLQGNGGVLTVPVNLFSYAPGTYFIKITGENVDITRKVIKY